MLFAINTITYKVYLIFDSPDFGATMFQCFALYSLFVVLTPVGWTPGTLALPQRGCTNCEDENQSYALL